MAAEEGIDSLSNKDEVMCAHSALWSGARTGPGESGKVSGRRSHFDLVLKGYVGVFLYRKWSREFRQQKQQSSALGNKKKFTVAEVQGVQGKCRKGHQQGYLRPS